MDGKNVAFLWLTFTNRTREVVYLRNVRVKGARNKRRECELPATPFAQRDIFSSCHPLRFKEASSIKYTEHEVILHDGKDIETVWPLSAEPHDNVLKYPRSWWRLRPCYFTLFYTAAVGDKLFKVVTKYQMPNPGLQATADQARRVGLRPSAAAPEPSS